MVTRWAGQCHGKTFATQHRLRGSQCASCTPARCGPAARHQGRARVKRKLSQPRRKVERRHIGAKAVLGGQRPDRGQGVYRRIGRVQRHPIVPGPSQKCQIVRRMHAGRCGVHIRRCIRRQQLPHRAALQFIEDIAQTVRHFVAIDQAAPEHFLAACVLGVVGVVEDFHGDFYAAGWDKAPCD